METRRAVLAGAASLPFLVDAARAARISNSELLLIRFSVTPARVPLDGELRLACSLEPREQFSRIFAPLHWGFERGFRLVLESPDGKTSEPKFHPADPLPPPEAFASRASYRELDVGEQFGFRTTVKARDIFPAAGKYRLHAVYLPEPSRAQTSLLQVIVFENGEVRSGSVPVTVT